MTIENDIRILDLKTTEYGHVLTLFPDDIKLTPGVYVVGYKQGDIDFVKIGKSKYLAKRIVDSIVHSIFENVEHIEFTKVALIPHDNHDQAEINMHDIFADNHFAGKFVGKNAFDGSHEIYWNISVDYVADTIRNVDLSRDLINEGPETLTTNNANLVNYGYYPNADIHDEKYFIDRYLSKVCFEILHKPNSLDMYRNLSMPIGLNKYRIPNKKEYEDGKEPLFFIYFDWFSFVGDEPFPKHLKRRSKNWLIYSKHLKELESYIDFCASLYGIPQSKMLEMLDRYFLDENGEYVTEPKYELTLEELFDFISTYGIQLQHKNYSLLEMRKIDEILQCDSCYGVNTNNEFMVTNTMTDKNFDVVVISASEICKTVLFRKNGIPNNKKHTLELMCGECFTEYKEVTQRFLENGEFIERSQKSPIDFYLTLDNAMLFVDLFEYLSIKTRNAYKKRITSMFEALGHKASRQNVQPELPQQFNAIYNELLKTTRATVEQTNQDFETLRQANDKKAVDAIYASAAANNLNILETMIQSLSNSDSKIDKAFAQTRLSMINSLCVLMGLPTVNESILESSR